MVVKKTLLTLTMITILVLALSSTAFAFGGFGGYGPGGACLRDSLNEEEQSRFASIIEQFRDKMIELREKMFAFRESGDLEGQQAVREERYKLMEEKRAAIGAYFPEYADRFQNFEGGKGYCRGRNGNGFNR